MSQNSNFDDTLAAYNQVVATVSQLKEDYAAVCLKVAAKKNELQAAPLAYIPIEDLKAGVLDFIDASGNRHGDDVIKKAISSFVTNGMSSMSADPSIRDKPMRFCDIDVAVNGVGASSNAQLLSPYKNQFDDQVLYFCIADLVKQRLMSIMNDMTPHDFGYDKIHPDKIGSSRAMRRTEIVQLTQELALLEQQKEGLSMRLLKLGIKVAGGN